MSAKRQAKSPRSYLIGTLPTDPHPQFTGAGSGIGSAASSPVRVIVRPSADRTVSGHLDRSARCCSAPRPTRARAGSLRGGPGSRRRGRPCPRARCRGRCAPWLEGPEDVTSRLFDPDKVLRLRPEPPQLLVVRLVRIRPGDRFLAPPARVFLLADLPLRHRDEEPVVGVAA